MSADHAKGPVLSTTRALALLVVVLMLGLCTLFVYWPINPWHYTVSAEKLMEQSPEATKEELQEYVLRALTQGVEDNQVALAAKQVAFRLAAGLLIAEIVLLVVFLTIWK